MNWSIHKGRGMDEHKRVGFATGYDRSLTASDMRAMVERADRLGYHTGFFSETIELLRDAPSSLATFARTTHHIRLGATMIVRLRTPVLMAQTMASLDELCGGRLMIAAGACTRSHAERHSLAHLNPAETLREWVESIRLLLEGEPVTYEGKHVQLNDVRLGWDPPKRRIPIFIPAISRTGLELAAEIADGVVLTSISSPEYSRNAVVILQEAVKKAGRDWDSFEVAQLVNCSLEDDRAIAFDKIRWEIATNFNPVQLPFVIRPKQRIGEPVVTEGDIELFEAAYEKGGDAALVKSIPDEYVENLTASGTPADVAARVQVYRDAGVSVPLLRPAALSQARRLLDQFAPHKRITAPIV